MIELIALAAGTGAVAYALRKREEKYLSGLAEQICAQERKAREAHQRMLRPAPDIAGMLHEVRSAVVDHLKETKGWPAVIEYLNSLQPRPRHEGLYQQEYQQVFKDPTRRDAGAA